MISPCSTWEEGHPAVSCWTDDLVHKKDRTLTSRGFNRSRMSLIPAVTALMAVNRAWSFCDDMRKCGLSCSGGPKILRNDLVFFYKAPERFCRSEDALAKEFIKSSGCILHASVPLFFHSWTDQIPSFQLDYVLVDRLAKREGEGNNNIHRCMYENTCLNRWISSFSLWDLSIYTSKCLDYTTACNMDNQNPPACMEESDRLKYRWVP